MAITLRQVFASQDLQGVFGIKPVRRTLPNACGACCVATALQHLGQPVTERNCVDAMGTNGGIGTTPEAMIRYVSDKLLQCHGYTKFPLALVLERVQKGKLTLIRWNTPDLWNVVVGYEPVLCQVVTFDPEAGFKTHDLSAFTDRWAASARLAIIIDMPRPEHPIKRPKKAVRVRHYRMAFTVDGRTVREKPQDEPVDAG